MKTKLTKVPIFKWFIDNMESEMTVCAIESLIKAHDVLFEVDSGSTNFMQVNY